jgi:hypothetical protein
MSDWEVLILCQARHRKHNLLRGKNSPDSKRLLALSGTSVDFDEGLCPLTISFLNVISHRSRMLPPCGCHNHRVSGMATTKPCRHGVPKAMNMPIVQSELVDSVPQPCLTQGKMKLPAHSGSRARTFPCRVKHVVMIAIHLAHRHPLLEISDRLMAEEGDLFTPRFVRSSHCDSAPFKIDIGESECADFPPAHTALFGEGREKSEAWVAPVQE